MVVAWVAAAAAVGVAVRGERYLNAAMRLSDGATTRSKIVVASSTSIAFPCTMSGRP